MPDDLMLAAASSAIALGVGVAAMFALVVCKCHINHDGTLARQKIVSAFLLGALIYTLMVLVVSQLFVKGPEIDELIRSGFGNERLGYLLAGVFLDSSLRFWEMFRDRAAA
ncbi:MAG: hypothetical protein AAFM92_15335 [Pseudomonadota bacterium]